jgi:hypothetical protein
VGGQGGDDKFPARQMTNSPVNQPGPLGEYNPWKKVSYAADCNADGDCSLCGEEYSECPCPGPTMDNWEYEWRDGELWAREEEEWHA